MKRSARQFAGLALIAGLLVPSAALATEAETLASATGYSAPPGSATATARYDGDLGFARTETRSGRVNLARGVAVGVDEDGLALSLSTAVAPSRGPAFAVSFNLSISESGEVAHSLATSRAAGGAGRTVTVGGSAGASRAGAISTALASGRTTGGGMVKVQAASHHCDVRSRYCRTVHPVVRSR